MAKHLISLLEDENFRREITIYRCAFQRLKVRLRNSPLIAQLRQVIQMTRELRRKVPAKLISASFGQLKSGSSKKQNMAVKLIRELMQFMDNSLDKMLQIYCYTQSHIRVGHLVQHLILVRASLARLRICFKAILIHASDTYLGLKKGNEKAIDIYNSILKKHDCKPQITQEESEDEIVGLQSEQIGKVIDRKTLAKTKRR